MEDIFLLIILFVWKTIKKAEMAIDVIRTQTKP